MKEFQLDLSKYLSVGLRPSLQVPINTPINSEVTNAKVTENGLESRNEYVHYATHNTSGIAVTSVGSDNERFLHGDRNSLYILSASAGNIYQVRVEDDDFTSPINLGTDTGIITIYESTDISSVKTVNLSNQEQMKLVDFGDTWYLFAKNGVMFKVNWGSTSDDRDGKYLWSDYPKVNAATYYKGRIVIGGFESSGTWGTQWSGLWERWREGLPGGVSLTEEDFGQNYILWSEIGEGLGWLIYPDIAVYGYMNDRLNYSVDNPFFFEMLRKNQLGWMALPCRGKIRQIVDWQTKLMVYADDAVFSLTPTTAPVLAYKVDRLPAPGIKQGTEVGSGSGEQIYISNEDELWKITDEGVSEIGYKTEMSSLIGSHVYITYDESDQEYCIGNSKAFYVYTKQGLSKVDRGVIDKVGKMGNVLTIDPTPAFTYQTHPFDMGMGGIKKITYVDLGLTQDSAEDIQVRVGVKYNKADSSFTFTSWINVNKEGCTFVNASGTQFVVGIQTKSGGEHANLKISSLKVSYQVSDKRMIRYRYAG